MEDSRIIELYWQRSEEAIALTERKYGSYVRTVANNILKDNGDTEECVNESYFNIWKSIPPARPTNFKGYIAAVVRNLSLNMYDKRHAGRRASEVRVIREEFFECLPSAEIDLDESIALKDAINSFLSSLSKEIRVIFVQRYFYSMSVDGIAKACGKSIANVKVILFRARTELRERLKTEGIYV